MLALKLIIVPLFIAGITFAGHRWGPTIAGWLAGLPIVSGPILLFIAIEQGPPFAAHAAISTVAGVVGVVAFTTVYCWAASRLFWLPSLLCGWAAYFVVIGALNATSPPLYVALPLTLAALLLGPRLFPPVPPSVRIAVSSYGEVMWRMAAGAVLVVLVTEFAGNLGPQLSGLFAVFPVVTSVLAVFSHRYSGYGCTVLLFRGLLYGLFAFVGFCFVLALWLPELGIVAGFVIALTASLGVQYLSRVALRRRG